MVLTAVVGVLNLARRMRMCCPRERIIEAPACGQARRF